MLRWSVLLTALLFVCPAQCCRAIPISEYQQQSQQRNQLARDASWTRRRETTSPDYESRVERRLIEQVRAALPSNADG